MKSPPAEAFVSEETRTNLAGQPQLLQLRSDRKLGHEWDDWDGQPLPDAGVFHESRGLFFRLAMIGGAGAGLVFFALWWLVAPRLALAAAWLAPALAFAGLAALVLYAAWLGYIAYGVEKGRNPLPRRLAEEGLLAALMPRLERLGIRLGYSRDRVGNSMLQVYNALASARARPGVRPEELLVLLPRCLSKQAMQGAMEISGRYGVPLFVAARGRYARQMIALRRPKRVVAVACERDLVSGIGDVAGKLPVLGTTLALPDGPCKNTEVELEMLESQIRNFLALPESQAEA